MTTVTVSPKFQVVIPKAVREALGIKAGEKLDAIPYRGHIALVPVRSIKGRTWLPQRHRHGRSTRTRPGMNVVDSSGWLEYFTDGPNAGPFSRPI